MVIMLLLSNFCCSGSPGTAATGYALGSGSLPTASSAPTISSGSLSMLSLFFLPTRMPLLVLDLSALALTNHHTLAVLTAKSLAWWLGKGI